MLDFLMNNKVYEIQANNQLSVILSQFDADYVVSIVDDTLQRQLNTFDLIGPPNAVMACEYLFKEYYITYPNEHTNIDLGRDTLYREIIDRICKWMNLSFNQSPNTDIYTLAYYLYDFYVAKFNKYLVTFYNRYLDAEKDQIYASFYLEDVGGKSKDMSSIYAQMAFSNDKSIALIVSNLQYVLSHLREMTVSDEYIYQTIYRDNTITELLLNNVTSHNGIFNLFNKVLFNPYLYPTVITHIRMEIQINHKEELNVTAGAQT